MFWYVISLTGSFDNLRDYDDLRVTDDRGLARLAMMVGMPVKVSAK